MAAARLKASWLDLPLVKRVVAALGADNIRFVGGAVRDTLIGKAVGDIDAATRLTPEDTMATLKAAGIRVVPTGLAHGTVTAVEDGQHVEITTLRIDVKTDGRHAEVAYTADWQADAARRDFTMNALYLTPEGMLFDPFGGLADLKAGHVRFIGNAEARIREDALRILRFFRFFAWYGKGKPDEEGVSACTALAVMLESLSAERVRDETLKLLGAPDPQGAWAEMAAAGIVDHLPGQGRDVAALGRLVLRERRLGIAPDPLIRLAAVAGIRPGMAKGLARALRLSGKEGRHLHAVAVGREAGGPREEKALRAFVYHEGREAGLAHLLGCQAEPDAALLHWVTDWPIPELPVRGRDLIALGVPEGPEVSKKLAEIETVGIESDFQSERSILLASIR